MKRTRIATIAAVLLVLRTGDAAGAAPRGPFPTSADAPKSAEEQRAETTMEMDAWLRRLVGRYYKFERLNINGDLTEYFKNGKRSDGTVVTGLVDCVGIGNGPGILCTMYSVVHKTGQEVSYRFTMLVEVGLDPNASKIRILMVMSDGSVGESTAVLSSDTASWIGMSCKQSPANECQTTMKISAPADGKYITWTYGWRIGSDPRTMLRGFGENYYYRLSPDEGNGPDGLPRTMAAPSLEIEVNRRVGTPGPR